MTCWLPEQFQTVSLPPEPPAGKSSLDRLSCIRFGREAVFWGVMCTKKVTDTPCCAIRPGGLLESCASISDFCAPWAHVRKSFWFAGLARDRHDELPFTFAFPVPRHADRPLFEGEHMARKLLNRKELRDEAEAAERSAGGGATATKKSAKTGIKSPPRRKSRAKTAKEVRLKAFWGVFSQALNPVVLFEYNERTQADQRAKELSESRKSPHFVQLVKKVIEE